jgi:hypothetical protein
VAIDPIRTDLPISSSSLAHLPAGGAHERAG